MQQLDNYVGRALAGLAFPTDGPGGRRPFDPGELVTAVCPMPALKMLQLATTPAYAPDGPAAAAAGARRLPGWGALVDECAERTPRYDLRQRIATTLSSQAIARGVAGELPDARAQARLQQLLGPSPVDWRLSASAATALPAAGAPRTLTVVSNRSGVGAQLEQLILRAQLQLSARAYVHHYERYGVDADFIAERIESESCCSYGVCVRPAKAIAMIRAPAALTISWSLDTASLNCSSDSKRWWTPRQ
jgi:hypothetical protein